MIITRKYIMKHRTPRGSWTRSQLKAIGVEWPPVRGWQKRAVGREISQEAARLFETKLTAKKERKSMKPENVMALQRRIRELEAEVKSLSNRALDCALCSDV